MPIKTAFDVTVETDDDVTIVKGLVDLVSLMQATGNGTYRVTIEKLPPVSQWENVRPSDLKVGDIIKDETWETGETSVVSVKLDSWYDSKVEPFWYRITFSNGAGHSFSPLKYADELELNFQRKVTK